jgi:hypothetical protein
MVRRIPPKPLTPEQRRVQIEALFRDVDGPPLKLPAPAQRRAQTGRNAAVSLAACKKQYEAGDKAALLGAINRCATAGLPIPDWAAKAFRENYRATAWEFKHRSWDDVFDKPNKGKNLHAARQARNLREKVYLRVLRLRKKRPKPRDIFQIVADEHCITRRMARRYFENFGKFYFGNALSLE